MKLKNKSLRHRHIWFLVWNSKLTKSNPPCDAQYQPVKISNK